MSWFTQQSVLNRLAALTGKGEHEEVVRIAEVALSKRPNDEILLMLLANSLDRLGQQQRAAGARERLVAVKPDDWSALFQLAQYYEQCGSHSSARDYYSRFLATGAPVYPLDDGDFRFLRFLARLFGTDGDRVESKARRTSASLDRDRTDNIEHAKRYLATSRGRAAE